MKTIQERSYGLGICILIAGVSHFLGKEFTIVGGAVFAILIGMLLSPTISKMEIFQLGITYTSKKILQYAVILLGFGLNLQVILQTGQQSLPIILTTIATSLLIAYVLQKKLGLSTNIATLIGVGSSICGGSAIAATAPVIDANDEEVAQAISVIFLFNILAALIFPTLGSLLGFSTTSGQAFGIFAGTAVNDTSSVTAAAATWDSLYHLGTQTLDKAVTVKLTRTLAIIPITLGLSYWRARQAKAAEKSVSLKQVFPVFILYFVLASIVMTLALAAGVPATFFSPIKEVSKFFIIMAMAAVGLKTNIVQLIKKGGKPILLGLSCWVGIILVSLMMQFLMGYI